MKTRLIRILDVGADDDVAKLSACSCALIDSMTALNQTPPARFEYVRLASPDLLILAIREAAIWAANLGDDAETAAPVAGKMAGARCLDLSAHATTFSGDPTGGP